MAARSPYSSRLWEPLDQWMESQGFYRKHTARDGSCLFRAVAEQVFHTQVLHSQVRMACVRFMQRHKTLFNECVEESFEEHISSMQNPWEWGGELEMSVMSFMYRCDFLVFREVGIPPVQATANGFKEKILLCYLQNNQYDSVYTKEHIKGAAYCQSLIYHLLYEKVFKMEDTDYAVDKMLHDKTVRLRRDSCINQFNGFTSARKQYGNVNGSAGKYDIKIEDISLEHKVSEDWYNNAKEILFQGIIPFPYKVAKALDPDIYRNIEFDVWNELRKELRWGISNNIYGAESGELRVGSKCLVRLDSLPGKELHAHIQEMANGKGPVLVYIEELAEKCTVQFDNLEPIPKPLKNSVAECEGEKRVGSWESHVTSNRSSSIGCLQNPSSEMNAEARNHRFQPWSPLTSTKNPKFSGQSHKDLTNGISNGRCEPKTCSSISKDTSGRKSSGCKGRFRPATQTSSLSPVSQSVPRTGCPSSTLNQDERYPQLVFTNHQLQINLQPQPSESSVNLAHQVTSLLESNASILPYSVKRPPSSANCTNSSACVTESGNITATSPGTTYESQQCEGWESQHNPIVQQVDREEQYWGPQATCCCCSFPVLEWRPASNGNYPPYVVSTCGGNVSPIQTSNFSRPLPPGVCLSAPESLLPDGGDLPYSDIPTLQFFYNLGHDYLRSGYFSWPNPIPYAIQQRKGGRYDMEVVEEEHSSPSSVASSVGSKQQHISSTIQSSAGTQQNIPYARQNVQQEQEFPSHLEEDEKHNHSAGALHFGYGSECQPSCHGGDHAVRGGRGRIDIAVSSSDIPPMNEQEIEALAPSGARRWLDASRQTSSVVPPYVPVAQPGTLSSSTMLPFPAPQGALEGQFYVYATATGPHHPQGHHHLMYGPIAQPHALSPPPPHLSTPITTRFVYPTVNSSLPSFAVSHQ